MVLNLARLLGSGPDVCGAQNIANSVTAVSGSWESAAVVEAESLGHDDFGLAGISSPNHRRLTTKRHPILRPGAMRVRCDDGLLD